MTLQQRDLLNPNSLGQPAYNIELTANHEAVWQAWDIAEIQPGNSPERINKFLQHHHILKNAGGRPATGSLLKRHLE